MALAGMGGHGGPRAPGFLNVYCSFLPEVGASLTVRCVPLSFLKMSDLHDRVVCFERFDSCLRVKRCIVLFI